MYIPKAFQETDQQKIKDFIRHNSFGILFSQNWVHPQATHLPLVFDRDDLVGHFAKANPHWRSLDGREALIVFSGPHSYISSSWYGEEGVPTWNYMTVHVCGTCRIITDQTELLNILKRSVDFYEAPLGHAWQIEEHKKKKK
ncbi:FMN-binding negative transcriptional regulator [Terrilactibacillus sp. S3-3]|nr:FMN-binding negative transcriptional regulator [Terrilactibacillus sp. S3-3]